MSWLSCTVSWMSWLKLECKFDELDKLRMSWISCTVSWMSWLSCTVSSMSWLS